MAEVEPVDACDIHWTAENAEKVSRSFREYSVADKFAATVHPRWEELKESANPALKVGEYTQAIRLYTDALKIADGSNVRELFVVIGERPTDSAGPKLAAASGDIAPIIQQYLPGPDISRGEPNRPAAICLANRAAVHLKIVSNSEAFIRKTSFFLTDLCIICL